MEPELDNWGVVELVYLAAHGDEAVAVLNLLDIFFSRCLCCDLTQHCLGGRWLQTHEGGSEKCVVVKRKGKGGVMD